MAESRSKRKPRMRKTAPTIRQTQEAATKAGSKTQSKRFKTPKIRLPKSKAASVLRGLIGKVTPSYFANSWREVRQVTWPSRRETWRLTLAVFVFAIVFGALVAGVDKGLDVIFKHTVLK